MEQTTKSALVSIREIASDYLPMSQRKVRKFVSLYLDPKRIGNRIYVDRSELEALLSDPDRESFPLNF